uniref:Uncharacterized protein n=1 Tax=viral metagenome TaxID=1070528 RepID=A0A6H2A4H0_9ZZZZ
MILRRYKAFLAKKTGEHTAEALIFLQFGIIFTTIFILTVKFLEG